MPDCEAKSFPFSMKKTLGFVLVICWLTGAFSRLTAEEPKLTLAQAQEIVAARLKQDGLADKKYNVLLYPGTDKIAPFYHVDFDPPIPDPKAEPGSKFLLSYVVDMAGKIKVSQSWVEERTVPVKSEPVTFQEPKLGEFWTKPLRFEPQSPVAP